jgi:tetratricopeptide (TPR) repeat protein
MIANALNSMARRTLLLIVASACTPGCMLMSSNYMPAYGGGQAQLFEGMGPYTRDITANSTEAKQYFNQGLNWVYGFNHDEAVRSFTKAAELDPDCAIAWWGIAHAQGPNYNAPMMGNPKSTAAWDALQEALQRIDQASPVERALIEALTHRYAEEEPKERINLDRAYADAMKIVWDQFSSDPDVGTLYAEAMMIRFPWMLYERDGSPARDETHEIVATLERVLELDAQHPGANHLYIHAVEPSDDKDRAIAAADQLSTLVPASGHLLHMPSHIYAQVGQWDKSIEQNRKANAADERYLDVVDKPGMQFGYAMHNTHMLAFSTMMVGRERESLAAARDMQDDVPWIMKLLFGEFMDMSMSSVYHVQKRFGRWDDLLAEPGPAGNMPVSNAVWRAHRAIAFAAKKDFENAAHEQIAFRAAMKKVRHDQKWPEYDMVLKFMMTSELFVSGEIALQKGNLEESIRDLEDAVAIEDMLGYGEPPLWLQPTRHALGAVYLKAGEYAEAERIYREDLAKWPRNGWSLYGLSRALEELGKTAEADKVRRDFEQVWSGADEPISTSCKCVPKL